MTPVLAGLFALGGPEVMLIEVAVAVVVAVLIVKAIRKPAAPHRYCPKWGRGLTQPAEAPFCCYCGTRLP
jgi:hypothetical protein